MSSKIIKATRSVKPIRMWIDGKCFNINSIKKTSVNKAVASSAEALKTEVLDHMEVLNEVDITADSDGKLSVSLQLPTVYYIKLHNVTDIKSLSEKTQTNISFPKQGQDGKLTVAGDAEKNIQQAVHELLSVISAIRDQHAAMQFIAIPLRSDEIRSNFEVFKNEILTKTNIKGMEESIFQKGLRLHLTVTVFSLLDEREKSEAINALEEYRNNVLCPLLEKSGPLKIHVAGLDCMNSNYKKVDVLYANAKIINETEDLNLQKIANELSDHFYEKGLVKRHQENVKLHMTLINTKYRKSVDSPNRRRWFKRESFDASHIMEHYKDFVFGKCSLDSIHLSLMSSKDEDGFYKSLSVIKI
ncbi:hypothetical protein NQ318_019690 [Aromia moschata]|uniref:A-kinase anchor protein 7-like phosphoesterase domain-containing protein n=1 Tax=Aromia moschata TaxID=1265417 RepID=A0AAV8Z5Y5_9CUCU|nr:hypothetical protein NQ318_019690 [Aromia moschata]